VHWDNQKMDVHMKVPKSRNLPVCPAQSSLYLLKKSRVGIGIQEGAVEVGLVIRTFSHPKSEFDIGAGLGLAPEPAGLLTEHSLRLLRE
jgi:hypothetical protein